MGIFKSAYATLYRNIRSTIQNLGIRVGGTAEYPRVELHSFIEDSPLDKSSSVRQVTLTVEADSVKSIGEAFTMLSSSLASLIGQQLNLDEDDFEIIGIVPEQLQDLTENIDSQSILYRLLQKMNVFIKTK